MVRIAASALGLILLPCSLLYGQSAPPSGHSLFAQGRTSSAFADQRQASGHSLSRDAGTRLIPPEQPIATAEDDSLIRSAVPATGFPVPPVPPETEVEAPETPVPVSGPGYWWEPLIAGPLLAERPPLPLSLEQVLTVALREAPELKVVSADWRISQWEIARQQGIFDPSTFIDSIWNRDSAPIGSDLDGAANRLRSRALSVTAGVRRSLEDGGSLALSQNVGLRNSNSRFLNPNNQGNSRLELSYERPLMRGAGEDYNTGPVQLSRVDADIAFERLQTEIQNYLLEVTRAYWNLVLRRGQYAVALRSYSEADTITVEMESRTAVDVTPVMLERTRSEAADRLASVENAANEILIAQATLLQLVYGRRFVNFQQSEILPLSAPGQPFAGSESAEPRAEALRNRSEIRASLREIRGEAIRYNIARSDIRPLLNLTLSGYVSGLEPDNDIGNSLVSQFREGEPGMAVGLSFELPVGRRSARAAAEQSRIALMRLQSRFDAVVSDVALEVENAYLGRSQLMDQLRLREEVLHRTAKIYQITLARRMILADGTEVADLYLENLLTHQGRVADAEEAFLQSQVELSMSESECLRARGILHYLTEQPTGARE